MKLNKESMLVYAITDRHWTGTQTLSFPFPCQVHSA